MLEPKVQAELAKLQKRYDGDSTSLFDHLSEIALHISEFKESQVDLCQLSELLKKQTRPLPQNDPLVPCEHKRDGTDARNALELFGYVIEPCIIFLCNIVMVRSSSTRTQPP
jgi:hypothetical protein